VSGFPATAPTLPNEMGRWNPDAVERQLGTWKLPQIKCTVVSNPTLSANLLSQDSVLVQLISLWLWSVPKLAPKHCSPSGARRGKR
jgi:hypothetical protein